MSVDSISPASRQGAHPSLFDKSVWLDAILAEPDLPCLASKVAMKLASHHNARTGQCNPSLQTLAKGIGKQPRATHDALTALRDAGYISWVTPRGSSNRYTLERITIGQSGAGTADPLHRRATPLAPACKRDLCMDVQPNSRILNARKNSISPPTPSRGPREGASRSGQNDNSRPSTWSDGLRLTNARADVARKHGIKSQPEIKKAWSEFELHHKARGSRFSDWDAAWEQWCLKRAEITQATKQARPAI